jgi:hypothetical protein
MRNLPVIVGGGLALVAAGLGLLAGLRAAPPSESAVIEAAAARYIRETGGMREDCSARPAPDPDLWLTVTCAAPGGALRAYRVDRRGRVLAGQDLS